MDSRDAEADRLRELAAETSDPVERDALLDTVAEFDGTSLTGDAHSRAIDDAPRSR